MITIHEVLERGWTPPHAQDRVLSLVQVNDFVLIITTAQIWRAEFKYDQIQVTLISHL